MQTKLKLAALGLLGALALSGCSGEKAPEAMPEGSNCFGGFIGMWNSTPADGDISGLPLEGVSVHSETGRKIDAFKRGSDGSAYAVPIEEVSYEVTVDPSWPKNNLVTIETSTGKVLDISEIPEQEAGCEPLAGDSGAFFKAESIAVQDAATGRTISEEHFSQATGIPVNESLFFGLSPSF